MDCSPPGSSVHGIFQASILEQVAIAFSRDSSQPRDQNCISFFLIYSFLIEGYLLYKSVLVLAVHQYESAIGIHVSPSSWTSLTPPTPSHSSGLSQSTYLSSLSQTANSHWLSILHMVMYMSPCYSLHSSDPLLPSLCPQVRSLCLCLHCCSADKFISTIYLDSIYMH